MTSIQIYEIEPGAPYLALRSTGPYDLEDYLDGFTNLEERYIRDSHKFYFGTNNHEINQDLSDLISLVNNPNSKLISFMKEWPPQFNVSAKDLYNKIQKGFKPIANEELKSIIKRELELIRNPKILLQEANDLMILINQEPVEYIPDLSGIKELVIEQQTYLEYELECQKFFVLVRYSGVPYGGIFIFYNENDPDNIVIQAITKYSIASIVNLPIKLNTILDPIINDIGKRLGAKYIYVNPIGKQGQILERYYGYRAAKTMPQPCPNLALTMDFQQVYYKEII